MAALRFGDLAMAPRLGMEATRCGAPDIYGQEHLGKHGKGRRHDGGGVGGGVAEFGTGRKKAAR